MKALELKVTRLTSNGYDVKLLTADDVRELEPNLAVSRSGRRCALPQGRVDRHTDDVHQPSQPGDQCGGEL